MFSNLHIFHTFTTPTRSLTTTCRIVFVLLLSLCFHLPAWAEYDVDTTFTKSFSSKSTIFTFTASDGSVITIKTAVSSSQEGSNFYAQLGSTPSNTSSYYIEVTSSKTAIESVEFLITGNGSDKSCQPIVLLWSGDVQSNSADSAIILDAITVANKGISNAEWFVYDCGDSETSTVRIYRAVKYVEAPPYSSSSTAIGNGQTIFIYGVRVTLAGEDENTLKWSNGLKDGGTVNKFITDPSFTYTATATLSTGDITYSSNNPDVATVNPTTGQVTIVGLGDAVITATQEAQGIYPATSITYNLHVTVLTNVLTWSGGLEDGATVTKSLSEGSVTYTASANLSEGTITYSSSDPTVATVDANGKVTFLTAGSTTITATQAATASYESTSITYELTISALDCSDKAISWGNASGSLSLPGGSCKPKKTTYYLPGVYLDTTEWYDNGCPKKIYVIPVKADTTATICEGSSFTWDRNGKTYNTKGTKDELSYSVTIPGVGTYSYTVRLKIVVSGKSTSSTTKTTIAPGGSCTWFGKQYTEQGTYTDTIPNKAGCDSIGTLILGVCDAIPDTITTKIVINEGSSYYWKYTDTKYNQSTKIDKDTINEFGCRTVMRLNLIVQRLSDADTAYSMCEGDVFEWHGLTITEAGKYTDANGKTIHVGVLPQPGVNACDDKIISNGGSAQFSVSGADYYKWWPTDSLGHKCLSSTWDTDPIATPLVSTMYYVKSYNSADKNSIINGDFELGPCGAASGKENDEYLPDCAQGTYFTHLWYTRNHNDGKKKFGTHMISHWSGELFGSKDKFPDHTKKDSTGWYMVIDGFNRDETPNDSILWQKEVEVTPGLDYIFSAWFVTLNNTSTLAELQFCVNGKPLGDVRYAPQKGNVWTRYYELWANDEKVTKATLTITNLNPNGDGNDFGLDDISFQALGPCFGKDSVKVTINFDIHLYPQQDDPNTIDTRTQVQVDSLAPKGVTKYETKFVNQTNPIGGSTTTTFNYGTGYYSYGDQLTVTAHDGEDDCFGFVQWADGETSPTRTYTVGVDDVSTITPIYGKKTYTIRVISSNGEQGLVSGVDNTALTISQRWRKLLINSTKFILIKPDYKINPIY